MTETHNPPPVPLGALVKDTITGYTGICTARTEWMNGCWRIVIQSRALHEGKPVDSLAFDAHQVVILDPDPSDVQRVLPTPTVAAQPVVAAAAAQPAPPPPAPRPGGPGPGRAQETSRPADLR